MTTDTTQVTFAPPGSGAEVAFLREYVVPAWDRPKEQDAFESGWVWRAGTFVHHALTELPCEE
jgi:hypothetical protein